jgi:hypothetical protein
MMIDQGERVANLFLVDSYCNLRKACDDLKLGAVVDPLNYNYKPLESRLSAAQKQISNITLYRACQPNEMPNQSLESQQVFAHYHAQPWNYLDTWIDPKCINLVNLDADSHTSWVRHESALVKICSTILRGFDQLMFS